MGGQPFREHYNVVPLDDLVAVLRGRQPANPAAGDVPAPLAIRTPEEVSGNWGAQKTIKYAPSATDIAQGVLAQQGLLIIDGANRRPATLTIDSAIAVGAGVGAATYPAGTDSAGNNLGYRAQMVISYGVSYGATGFRTDNITVDIGRRVTVSANIVYVNALALPPPAGYAAGSMNVGAIIGLYDGLSQAPAVSTSYIDGLASLSASTPIIIPAKAGFLLPVQTSDVTNLMQLDFFDQAGQPVTSLQFSAGQMVAPLPISSSDYYSMTLTNLAGAAQANYRLPFQLSL